MSSSLLSPRLRKTAPRGRLLLDVPSAAYHLRELGVASKTALDHVARSLAHYKAWVDGALEEEETPALRFGRAFHCAILEPAKFEATYVIEPDFGDLRLRGPKRERKAWRIAQMKTILSCKDGDTILGMGAAIAGHPWASMLLTGGIAEATVRWNDPRTGLKCQARLDYYVEATATVVDLKSAEDARPEAFLRSVANYRYHVQDVHYRTGLRAAKKPVEDFLFMVVEKKPPHNLAIYRVDPAWLNAGERVVRANIDTLARAVRTGEWSGYPLTIQTIRMPAWAA